jgi:hypothetical protein
MHTNHHHKANWEISRAIVAVWSQGSLRYSLSEWLFRSDSALRSKKKGEKKKKREMEKKANRRKTLLVINDTWNRNCRRISKGPRLQTSKEFKSILKESEKKKKRRKR